MQWKDNMQRAGLSAMESNIGNIPGIRLHLYRAYLEYERLSGGVSRFDKLEFVFYKAPTKGHREHLLYDMMSDYVLITEALKRIRPTITYQPVNNDRQADHEAQKAAVRNYLQLHHLSENYLVCYNVFNDTISLNCEDEIFEELELNSRNIDRMERVLNHALLDMRSFIRLVDRITSIYDLDIKRVKDLYLHGEKQLKESEEQQELETRFNYQKMPRTHRIAAVWGLIDRLGLRKTKDKTTLAAFVEAVTGGNIKARPQDTVAYKKPERSAKEAAAEWLKKIGIE
ncbi:hypothetical protein B5G09_05565 [Alistipes sp. An54]|nr:hypothetical protein B5G09_05565 [Alistipes sp. An54]